MIEGYLLPRSTTIGPDGTIGGYNDTGYMGNTGPARGNQLVDFGNQFLGGIANLGNELGGSLTPSNLQLENYMAPVQEGINQSVKPPATETTTEESTNTPPVAALGRGYSTYEDIYGVPWWWDFVGTSPYPDLSYLFKAQQSRESAEEIVARANNAATVEEAAEILSAIYPAPLQDIIDILKTNSEGPFYDPDYVPEGSDIGPEDDVSDPDYVPEGSDIGPDRDGDGIPDADDLWPDNPDPHGLPPPVQGSDTDGDGIPDGIDRYPNDPTNTPPADDSLIISENPLDDADVEKKANEQLEKDLEGLPEEEKKTWRQRLAEWFRGRRLAKGKTPGLSLGWPTWLGTGVIGGGIAKIFGGGSGSSPTFEPGMTIDTTGGLPGVDTPEKALEAAKIKGNWEKMSPVQQQGAHMAAKVAAPGSLPPWLLPLLGLAALSQTGGSGYGGAPGTLQEAAARRSMEVYGNADLFDPIGGSPLTAMDPRFKNLQSFMPAGEVPDFNLGYRGMPGQLYANYQGIGPLGTPGPQGNIWATQPLNRGGTFQPPPPQQNYVPINQPGGIPGLLPFNNLQFAAGGGEANFPRRNGQIAGPGTETSDDIPAMLSDGEFVVNAKAVRGIGNLMGKRPKSKAAQRREGARAMYELQKKGERAARMA